MTIALLGPTICYYSYMISQITGRLIDQNDKEVTIDIGGIGYSVNTTIISAILGENITLYTHMIIKDDAHELYGFQTKQERDLFRVLISVSGVGPRTGLAMMNLYTLPDLVRIIKNGDSKAVALVPGIGKKTAEKVVIDLKDKVEGFEISAGSTNTDLVEALISLGYKEYQVRPITGNIDSNLPIEKQITEALKLMQK